jgi:hypothetical protein
MKLKLALITLLIAASASAMAEPKQERMSTELESSIEKLDKINHLPNLLPVIIENSDFIGLTKAQLTELNQWRDANREAMLAAMQQIALKRVAIRDAAIAPTVSSARLQQMQNEIFRLQREVLQYKLSCRDHIVRTFNQENWTNFFIVLADEGIGVSVPINYAVR